MGKRQNQRNKSKGIEFRSHLEDSIAEQLRKYGTKFEYERESYTWRDKVPNAKCEDCQGDAYVDRTYTPDFFLENGVVIEVKGIFTVKDRKIAMAMKEQHPEVRMVYIFSKDNKLSRNAKTRYTEWCKNRDIPCCVKEVRKEWLR